jgi:hypothetical protein
MVDVKLKVAATWFTTFCSRIGIHYFPMSHYIVAAFVTLQFWDLVIGYSIHPLNCQSLYV